jgi:5'-deoxynucleotidase
MPSSREENIQEHSLQVAMIAHALALLRNKRFGGNVDPERCALLAMYHDVTEIITGDLPTPIKYFSREIRGAYDEVEKKAERTLISYLPDDLKEDYRPLFSRTEEEGELWDLVKAADKLSAFIKCLEELGCGNTEFKTAKESTLKKLKELREELPELKIFMNDFLSAYEKTLDELQEKV